MLLTEEVKLLDKGFDTQKIKELLERGLTLKKLKHLDNEELKKLKVNEQIIDNIKNTSRKPINKKIVEKILYESRLTCCICRKENLPVIIHHMTPWEESYDNSENNLVVLCLNHHDLAHSKKLLSTNLTPKRIFDAKRKWLEDVKENDNKIANKKILLDDNAELVNIIRIFSLDVKDNFNVLSWFQGAEEDSGIEWLTEGVQHDEEYGSVRVGKIKVKLFGQFTYLLKKTLVPQNWEIKAYGARAGISGIILLPETNTELFQSLNDIVNYFKKNDIKIKSLESMDNGTATSENSLFEIKIPNKKRSYLKINSSYGSAGYFFDLNYFLYK